MQKIHKAMATTLLICIKEIMQKKKKYTEAIAINYKNQQAGY